MIPDRLLSLFGLMTLEDHERRLGKYRQHRSDKARRLRSKAEGHAAAAIGKANALEATAAAVRQSWVDMATDQEGRFWAICPQCSRVFKLTGTSDGSTYVDPPWPIHKSEEFGQITIGCDCGRREYLRVHIPE